MNLQFTPQGWADYLHWQSADPAMLDKVNILLREVRRDPFRGIGKPEPLRNDFKGWWSRRITVEHRLVYRVVGSGSEQRVEIAQCRYHYG